MKNRRFELNRREQQVMELLWNHPEGLTSVDILDKLNDELINPTYAHRTINSLLKKELIIEQGTVRYNKQYARKFIPTMQREEFGANLLLDNGFDASSISPLVMALVKQEPSSIRKTEVIEELKNIIHQLREDS